MASVVQRMNPSVHAAYRNSLRKPAYALSALYDKLNGIEPGVSAAFVADHAQRMHEVVDELHATLPPLVPGYATRILDGNAIAATEHRLKVLRDLRSGALPGKTLVVLDYEYDLVTHVIPCEDGHAQERSLTNALLSHVDHGQLWIADRNFCTTKILRGIHARGGSFLIREHRKIPLYEETPFITRSSEKKTILKEQTVYIEVDGEKLPMRRVLLKLSRPTRDGDKEIVILTTLPLEVADAQTVMDTYRKRGTIETMFAHLTTALQCEVAGLGHPRAALFAFATALVAANTLSAVRAALRGVHGIEVEERVSMYHLKSVDFVAIISSRTTNLFLEKESV